LKVSKSERTRLKDRNWAYSQYDILCDWIKSNLTKIQEEYQTLNERKKLSIIQGAFEFLLFKQKKSYDKVISIHETIHSTTFLIDKKYHGPFREEIGAAFFNESKALLYGQSYYFCSTSPDAFSTSYILCRRDSESPLSYFTSSISRLSLT
jgi:hypothetical protein